MRTKINKQKVKLMVSILSLSVSLTSLLYVTYSWFIFQHTHTTNFASVRTESGMKYEIKYFTKNYPEDENAIGYRSPNEAATPADIITVDDYDTDFQPIEDDPLYNAVYNNVDVAAQYPGLRFTYSIEITGEFSEDRTVQLILAEYLATASTTRYDTTTNQGITIAKATNIYATAFDSTEDVTTLANNFVTNENATDLFTMNDPDGPANILLAYHTLAVNQDENDKVIYLFTVEFSNDPSTFFTYDSTIGNIDYYEPDIAGDSNAYKNLSFKIEELYIHVL